MFHRVKIEDQPQGQQPQREPQPAPRAEAQPPRQETQQNFFAQEERAPENRQPQQRARETANPSAERKEAQAPSQSRGESQNQQNASTNQQPQKKDRAPMNPAKDYDKNDNQDNAEQAQRPMSIPGGYQAANQPARMPGGYPGAYPGYNVKPAAAEQQRPASNAAAPSAAQALTIGRGITMSGEIEACEHLIVEGTVEASLKGARVLDVAETGTFYGAVEIERATIAGRFEGDLTVNGRLTVRSTGAISGSISYKELEVESGAVLEGRITALKSKEDAARKNSGRDASQAAKSREFNSQQDQADDASLFGKAAAAE